MISRCKELIKAREQIIDNLEEAVRNGRYTEALRIIHETGQFRLPPNYSEMEPDDDDLAANDRISQADKILRSKFEEKIPLWVENDKWDEINNAFNTFGDEEDTNWKRLNDELRGCVNKKIADRYNLAVECETKGKVIQAEGTWNEFLKIPQSLMPSNLWEYASNFESRKKIFLQSKRNKTINRVLIAALITWTFPIFVKVLPMLVRYYTTDGLTKRSVANLILPGLLNFGIFAILSGVLISEKIVKDELRRPTLSSTRTNILFCLLACSPISFILYEIISWTLSKYSLPLPSAWFPFIAITLFWFVLDVLRRYFWQNRGIFPLCLSWVVTSILSHFFAGLLARGFEIWPLTLVLHGVLYAIFLIPERKVSYR